MTSKFNSETLGLLGALLLEQHSHYLSAQSDYEALQIRLRDLVNHLAFDRVAQVLIGHAEYYFQQGEWLDAEPYVRDVMALMGRSDEVYGRAAMIRGYMHLKIGEMDAGIGYLTEAVASCAETGLSSPLEEMKRFIYEQTDEPTLQQETFQQLLHLCDSTLETLHSKTSHDEH